ncbi:MAG: gliding motility-associated C-terminal domain-containing protein [Flavobacteriales bacterium]|nr:gliding motility-associated C-terminal domain-containing protein [Flavobacteriales bacterium]
MALARSISTLLLLVPAFGLRAQDCQLLCNGDFEDGVTATPNTILWLENGDVPCWGTTASDSVIEMWGNGYEGVNAYSGVQFMELCANMFAGFYQDFTATPGQEVIINLAHRARMVAPDVMEVRIGHDGAWSVVATVSDGLTWVYHTYTYTLPVGGSNTFTLLFFPISSGTSNPGIGNFIDDVSISLPPPQVSLTNTPITCAGAEDGSATATVVDGAVPFIYLWSPTGGTDTAATGLSAGSYLFTVTDANGCVDTASTTIVEGTGPALTLQGTNTLCNGASNGSAQAVATSGSAPFSYQWSPAGGTNALADGLSAGPYTCTITDANGCSSAATVQIDEPTPVAVAAFDTLVCHGSSATLLAQASGGTPGYTFNWSPQGPAVAPDTTTNYTVVVTDAQGCLSAMETVTVTVPILPPVLFTTDTTAGCPQTCINFDTEPYPALSLLWDFGDGQTGTAPSIAHCYPTSGTYDIALTISDGNGCSQTTMEQDLITIWEPFPPEIQASSQLVVLDAPVVDFDLDPTGTVAWSWDFGDGSDGTSERSPSHRFRIADCFMVTLMTTDLHACMGMDSVRICVNDVASPPFVPNAFTPEGDGVNDVFRVINVPAGAKGYEFLVFDRWGGVIFSSGTPDSSWDGEGTPIGTYAWKLRYQDVEGGGKEYFGQVTLLR